MLRRQCEHEAEKEKATAFPGDYPSVERHVDLHPFPESNVGYVFVKNRGATDFRAKTEPIANDVVFISENYNIFGEGAFNYCVKAGHE